MKRKIGLFSLVVFVFLIISNIGTDQNLAFGGSPPVSKPVNLSIVDPAEVVDDGEFFPFGIDLDLNSSGDPYIVFTFVDLFLAYKSSGYWDFYKIEDDFCDYPSIVIDSSGHFHISYDRYGDLYYATDRNDYLEIELIDNGDHSYTSIALDSGDIPHISYYDEISDDLKYAVRVGSDGNCGDGNAWMCWDVDTEDDVGSYNSIAIDNDDKPFISYRDATNNKLKYAIYQDALGYWASIELAPGGFYSSLAFDSDNKPHIGYLTDMNGGVYHAYKDIVWDEEYVDAAFDSTYGVSLSINSADVPSISYINYDTGQVLYSYRVGSGGNCGVSGQWQCDVVSGMSGDGLETSLQFDSSDKPYLAFTGSLNFAKKEADIWTIEPLLADVGSGSSLALNPVELPAIGYIDYTFDDLKFARWNGTSWSVERLTSGSYAGYPSLAFDQNGFAHLSYMHEGHLKYATDEGGSWQRQNVDTNTDVGHYSSIAVDRDNGSHISYVDDNNADLKYANNSTGVWLYEVVDDERGVSTSLALDYYGLPHISYFNASNQLSYAVRVGGGSGDCYAGSNWDCETQPYYGAYCDMMRDVSGNSYIIFWETGVPGSLRYMTRDTSGLWQTEKIYTSMNPLFDIISGSIALDDEDNPHIAFCDQGFAEMYYGYRVGSGGNCGDSGEWECKLLPYPCHSAPSIAVDELNIPHISFSTRSQTTRNLQLMYMRIEPPDAVFSGTPTNGPAPLDVTFSNESTGMVESCSWDFGDGESSNECHPAPHTYNSSGVYSVELIVTGLVGENTSLRTDYITVYEPAIAEFTGNPTSGTAPLEVSFTNQSSGIFDTCAWVFGDGVTSNECNPPPHTYTTPGVYTVSLTVSGLGGEDTKARIDYICVEGGTGYQYFMPIFMR